LLENQTRNLTFSNSLPSTTIKQPESPDEIRQTAPAYYRTQNRLVTTQDYETFSKSNFANLITDIRVINNWDYVSTYLKYFYDIGIQDPLKTERALLNQVLYADACNFNNVYLIVVPRSETQNLDYLLPSQKELISSTINPVKVATTEIVFTDPVYKAFSLGVYGIGNDFSPPVDTVDCELQIIKRASSRRDSQTIINEIVNIFRNYFSRKSLKLGQIVDIRNLNQQILSIDGVETFYTVNTNTNIKTEGLSFFVWNPIYTENDKLITSNNVSLRLFEYPFMYDINDLAGKINVQATTTTNFETVEY
jgi:hypothetical protein